MKKLISVFGPSECMPKSGLYSLAEELGAGLARAGFAVVSGGYEGVMEAVSKGARREHGSTIGVTAEVYFARGREANEFLTREVRVKSAVDALMELIDIPDAYVAIGNSTGTLIEVTVAWDYIIKRFIPKKPILLIGEGWKHFINYARQEEQFLPFMELLEHHASPDKAIARLTEIFGAQLRLPDLTILQPGNE